MDVDDVAVKYLKGITLHVIGCISSENRGFKTC